MLDLLKAVIFGIVEGVTEWLPISSTGHMILLDEVLTLKVSDAFYELFQVVIQLGAILAVVVLYFTRLNPFSARKNRKQRDMTWSLLVKIVAAVIPSAVIGLLLDDWMDAHLYNYIVVAVMLIVYGVAFILVERRNQGREPRINGVYSLDLKTALGIGLFQCLSLIPGTSRSGATILGGILLGASRNAAAEFSFFLAIPTMFGASLLKVVKFIAEGSKVTGNELLILLVGCIVAFLVSMLVIRALTEYVRKSSFSLFGGYRIVLGILVLLYFLIQPK